MKKTLWFLVLGVTLGPMTLAGCEQVYSPAIKYGVRTDPLVLNDQLGEERYDPDSPGILPILATKDIFDPRNPMYPKREVLFKEGKLLDPTLLTEVDRKAIEGALVELFGSPARPRVAADAEVIKTLKLQPSLLAKGSALYRIHCLHCHGVPGDGRGPTARWVNPHPRDYRQGLFKFQSVNQTDGKVRPPLREDLRHTLEVGVEGTGMPAFNLLPPEDLEAMVSYVIHLSIRGKAEFDTIAFGFAYDSKNNTLALKTDYLEENEWKDLKAMVQAFAGLTANNWLEAQGKKIQIDPYPYKEGDQEALKASVLRGFQYFNGKGSKVAEAANCVSCHKDYGRQAAFKFDAWGTMVKPRNLVEGTFRGGRRPIDVYYRIHSGINGSGMANFGNLQKMEAGAVWDLVNFVQTLPYTQMRASLGIKIE